MQSLFKELLPDVEIGALMFVHRHLLLIVLTISNIEKASIDEAFFDFTKLAKIKLLERFPYLASVPHDAPRGVDSPLPPPPPLSWEGLGTVIPVHPPAPSKAKEEGKEGVPKAMRSQRLSSLLLLLLIIAERGGVGCGVS